VCCGFSFFGFIPDFSIMPGLLFCSKKLTIEAIHGLMSQVIKDHLFNHQERRLSSKA